MDLTEARNLKTYQISKIVTKQIFYTLVVATSKEEALNIFNDISDHEDLFSHEEETDLVFVAEEVDQ